MLQKKEKGFHYGPKEVRLYEKVKAKTKVKKKRFRGKKGALINPALVERNIFI